MTKELPHPPFPEPSELWEGCHVRSWPVLEQARFVTELTYISSSIIYCEQPVINRVKKYIENIIAKANAGELSSDEACRFVTPQVVFTKEELEIIEKNSHEQGEMLGNFYQNKGSSN